MKALTLHPEWAYAITHLGKDVENRCWPMPAYLVGEWVAIHAGKHIGGRPGLGATNEGLRSLQAMASRAGVPSSSWAPRDVANHGPKSAIVALVRFGPSIRDSRSGWAVPGEWHWPILEVRPLPTPIPCGGAQRLWTVPFEVEVPDARP